MKKYSFFILLVGLWMVGCTPKTAKDMADKTMAEVKTGPKAPVIEIPSGPDVRKSAPKPGTPPAIQVGKAATSTLPNGMKLIVVENHKLPRVSFQVFIDKDPIIEGASAGYVDMVGNMLSKGTTTRTKTQIDEAVDFIGASLGTSASGASGECLTKHADALLTIMSDVLLNPSFPEAEFQKQKKQAASGLAQSKDDPNSIAANVKNVLNYGSNHPYGENMSEQTLEKIELAQVRLYYSTYFKPNQAYLVVVGDVTARQVQDWATKYFGGWQKGEMPKHAYPMPTAPAKTQVDFVHKSGAVQSVVNVTYPLDYRPGNADAIKASVMNTIFGGYFNSRINDNLREKRAFTYGARSGFDADERVGSFNANASVRNEVTDSAITEVIYEMERMRNEIVPEDELSLVKNVMTGTFSRNLEEPETVARFALNIARYGLPADYYETYLAKLAAVTAADVQEMAKKYLHPDKAHILVVGNKDVVAPKLERFGTVRFYDAYGKPVEDLSKSIPSELSGPKVIEDYVNAIGGTAAVATVKDMTITGSMEGMGMPITFRSVRKDDNKLLMEVSMNGQVLSRQVYINGKGSNKGMGGPAEAASGAMLETMVQQAMFVKEANYAKLRYPMVLKGAETFEGKKAFVVEVTMPSGSTATEYYDMSTGLKIGEVNLEIEGGETNTITTGFSDYQAVNGVLFPKVMSIKGPFPVPVKMIAQEIKINTGVKDEIFTLD